MKTTSERHSQSNYTMIETSKIRLFRLSSLALSAAFATSLLCFNPRSASATGSSGKGEAEALMTQGNQDYQNKAYEKAISAYQEVIKLGYIGTSVYYNLGDAYYRDSKLGYAILYYEKASRLSPGDNDVVHNLEIANARTIDKVNTLPPFFLFQWWESFLALFSLNGWTYAAYVFFLLVLGSVLLYFFARTPGVQKVSVFAGLFSVLLLILTVSVLMIKLNRTLNIQYGVIVNPVATVKLSPDSTSNDAFIIHEGLKVRELEQVGDWVEIRLADGKEGWIQQNEVGTI